MPLEVTLKHSFAILGHLVKRLSFRFLKDGLVRKLLRKTLKGGLFLQHTKFSSWLIGADSTKVNIDARKKELIADVRDSFNHCYGKFWVLYSITSTEIEVENITMLQELIFFTQSSSWNTACHGISALISPKRVTFPILCADRQVRVFKNEFLSVTNDRSSNPLCKWTWLHACEKAFSIWQWTELHIAKNWLWNKAFAHEHAWSQVYLHNRFEDPSFVYLNTEIYFSI